LEIRKTHCHPLIKLQSILFGLVLCSEFFGSSAKAEPVKSTGKTPASWATIPHGVPQAVAGVAQVHPGVAASTNSPSPVPNAPKPER
jgi:hypothetical protein